jgi:hypothetical protein
MHVCFCFFLVFFFLEINLFFTYFINSEHRGAHWILEFRLWNVLELALFYFAFKL